MSETQVYDKAKWHYEGDHYPEGLPEANAYTHGGFHLAWLVARGLVAQEFMNDHAAAVQELATGQLSAGQFYQRVGGVIDSEMLTETGNAFAEEYIEEEYLEDYELLLEDDSEEIYEVADNKQNLKRVSKLLDDVFSDWEEAAVAADDEEDDDN